MRIALGGDREVADLLAQLNERRGRISLWLVEDARLGTYHEFLASIRPVVRTLLDVCAFATSSVSAFGAIDVRHVPQGRFDWHACFLASRRTLLSSLACELGKTWLGSWTLAADGRDTDVLDRATRLVRSLAGSSQSRSSASGGGPAADCPVPDRGPGIVAPGARSGRPRGHLVVLGGTRGLGAALVRSMAGLPGVCVAACGRGTPDDGGTWSRIEVLSFGDVERTLHRDDPGGVVFAAGSFTAGAARHADLAAMERVLETKVIGCMNVVHALEAGGWREPLLLVSSLSAAGGEKGKGLAYYAAAHAFVEAAAQEAARLGRDVCALRLPLVRGVGHAGRFESRLDLPSCETEEVARAVTQLLGGRSRGVYELRGSERTGPGRTNDGPARRDAGASPAGAATRPDVLARACATIQAYLGGPTPMVTPATRLDELGLDSLELIELGMKLADEAGIDTPAGASLRALSVAELIGAAQAGGRRLYELLPQQVRFATAASPRPSRLFAIFEVEGTAARDLPRALSALTARHPALRCRPVLVDGLPAQVFDSSLGPRELAPGPGDDPAADLHPAIARALADDPVPWGLSYCTCPLPDGRVCLGLGVPHMFVDGVSLLRLVEELLDELRRPDRPAAARPDPWIGLLRELSTAAREVTACPVPDAVPAAASSGDGRWSQRRLAVCEPLGPAATQRRLVERFEEICRAAIASELRGEVASFFRAGHGRTVATRGAIGNLAVLVPCGGPPVDTTGPVVVLSALGRGRRHLRQGLAEGSVSCGVSPGPSDVAVVHWFEGQNLCFSLSTSASAAPGLKASKLADAIEAAWAVRFPALREFSPEAFHDWLAERTRREPSRIAALLEDRTVTYAELHRTADEVFGHLGAVDARSPVVVRGPAGPATTAAMLAAWRAGRSVLPVDPHWPAPHWLPAAQSLGCETLLEVLPREPRPAASAGGFRVVRIAPAGVTSDAPKRRPGRQAVGLHPGIAYYLLTSGTTGVAKTVAMGAEAVRAFLEWCAEEFAFTPEDIFLQAASIGFGASIRQHLSPLLCGAAAVPISAAEINTTPALLDRILATGATVLNFIPTVAGRLLAECERRGAGGLGRTRLALVGGDLLSSDLAAAWAARFGAVPRLVNLYGSAETIVNATACLADPAPDLAQAFASVGLPRPGYAVEVRHRGIALRKDGEPGELVVVGRMIAEGYVDREGRLVPFPPAARAEPGARSYRTGDWGYRRGDGRIFCLGRAGAFAKINGVRVGLAEVEEALRSMPDVLGCAVVAVRARPASESLVAFYEAECNLDDGAIRTHLAARLPRPFVPGRFVRRDALPRTSSGKVRREALRDEALALEHPEAPADAAPRPGRNEPPPDPGGPAGDGTRDQVRAWVAAEWRRVVGTTPLPGDNFFSRGGDSMRAIEVAKALGAWLGRPLPSTLIFFHPTFDRLVTAVADLATRGDGHGRPGPAFPAATPMPGGETARPRPASELTPRGHLWWIELPLRGKWNATLKERAAQAVARAVGEGGSCEERTLTLGGGDGLWREFRAAGGPLCAWLVDRDGEAADALWVAADHRLGDLAALLAALGDGPDPSTLAADPAEPEDGTGDALASIDLDRMGGRLVVAEGAPAVVERAIAPDGTDLARWLREASMLGLPAGFYVGHRLADGIRRTLGLADLLVAHAVDGRLGVPASAASALRTGVLLQGVEASDPESAAELAARLWADLRAWLGSPAAASRRLREAAATGKIDLFVSVSDFRGAASGPFDLSRLRIESDFRGEAVPCAVTLLVFEDRFLLHVRGSKASGLAGVVERCLVGPTPGHRRPASPALDAAMLAYLPEGPLAGWLGLSDHLLDAARGGGRPLLVDVRRTRLGRSGLITLPLALGELIRGGEARATEAVLAAIGMAREAGAGVVTCGGLLSAYLKRRPGVLATIRDAHPVLAVSDGHATTVAAIREQVAVLAEAVFGDEPYTLGIAGTGSIGAGVLAALLASGRYPARVVLFDSPGATEAAVRHVDSLGLVGSVDFLPAGPLRRDCPELDGVEFLVGAVSAGPPLPAEALAPGTVVVDDSFPPLIPPSESLKRMRRARDVLIVSGGGLTIPGPARERPEAIPRAMPDAVGGPGCQADDFLPGCQLEGLLVARGLLAPALAPVPALEGIEVVGRLLRSGVVSLPEPHLLTHRIDDGILGSFREAGRTARRGR